MTTTTVLRLKRRITDEPLKALVVSYKRPRLTELQQTDTPEFTEISAVRQEIFQLSDDSTRFKKALQSYGESSEEKNISTEPSEYIWSGTKVCRQAENVKIHLGDIKLTNRQLLAGSRQRQRDRLMKVIRSIDKSAVVDVGSTNEVRLKLDSSAAESVFAEMAGLVDAVEPSNKQEKTKDKKMEETILCNGVPMRRVANQDLESVSFTTSYDTKN